MTDHTRRAEDAPLPTEPLKWDEVKSRVSKYLDERAKMPGLHQSEIASLHIGDDREAILFAADLRELLEAAPVQAWIGELPEPVLCGFGDGATYSYTAEQFRAAIGAALEASAQVAEAKTRIPGDLLGAPSSVMMRIAERGEFIAKAIRALNKLAPAPAAAVGAVDLRLTELLNRIQDFSEINPSNYHHEDVCDMNNWGIDVALLAAEIPKAAPGMPVPAKPEQARSLGDLLMPKAKRDAIMARDAKLASTSVPRDEFEAQARRAGHINFTRMAGDPETYDDLILRAEYRGWLAAHIARQPQAAPEVPACPACGGSGETMVLSGGGPDAYEEPANCPHCNGNGGLDDAYRGVVALLAAEQEKYRKACGQLYFASRGAQPVAQGAASEQQGLARALDIAVDVLGELEGDAAEQHGAWRVREAIAKEIADQSAVKPAEKN